MPACTASRVPIGVVGERLGVLLIVFDELAELDEDIRHVLTVVAAGLGFIGAARPARGLERRPSGEAPAA